MPTDESETRQDRQRTGQRWISRLSWITTVSAFTAFLGLWHFIYQAPKVKAATLSDPNSPTTESAYPGWHGRRHHHGSGAFPSDGSSTGESGVIGGNGTGNLDGNWPASGAGGGEGGSGGVQLAPGSGSDFQSGAS